MPKVTNSNIFFVLFFPVFWCHVTFCYFFSLYKLVSSSWNWLDPVRKKPMIFYFLSCPFNRHFYRSVACILISNHILSYILLWKHTIVCIPEFSQQSACCIFEHRKIRVIVGTIRSVQDFTQFGMQDYFFGAQFPFFQINGIEPVNDFCDTGVHWRGTGLHRCPLTLRRRSVQSECSDRATGWGFAGISCYLPRFTHVFRFYLFSFNSVNSCSIFVKRCSIKSRRLVSIASCNFWLMNAVTLIPIDFAICFTLLCKSSGIECRIFAAS